MVTISNTGSPVTVLGTMQFDGRAVPGFDYVGSSYSVKSTGTPSVTTGYVTTFANAMGATVMLGIQTFIIIGGVLKLIPLTGVTMPFVSYGGTSLVSCMGLIGLIQGVASVNQDDLAYDYEISHTLQEEALMPEADRE